MCEAVREDKRLAHTLDREQPAEGIVLPVCEKDVCGDAGAEGGEKMEDVVLARSVRSGENAGEG